MTLGGHLCTHSNAAAKHGIPVQNLLLIIRLKAMPIHTLCTQGKGKLQKKNLVIKSHLSSLLQRGIPPQANAYIMEENALYFLVGRLFAGLWMSVSESQDKKNFASSQAF